MNIDAHTLPQPREIWRTVHSLEPSQLDDKPLPNSPFADFPPGQQPKLRRELVYFPSDVEALVRLATWSETLRKSERECNRQRKEAVRRPEADVQALVEQYENAKEIAENNWKLYEDAKSRYGKVLPCGHPEQCNQNSAETGKVLYCGWCNAVSYQRDLTTDQRERAEKAEKSDAFHIEACAAHQRHIDELQTALRVKDTEVADWTESYWRQSQDRAFILNEKHEIEASLSTVSEQLKCHQDSQENLYRYCNDETQWELPMTGKDLTARDKIRCLRESHTNAINEERRLRAEGQEQFARAEKAEAELAILKVNVDVLRAENAEHVKELAALRAKPAELPEEVIRLLRRSEKLCGGGFCIEHADEIRDYLANAKPQPPAEQAGAGECNKITGLESSAMPQGTPAPAAPQSDFHSGPHPNELEKKSGVLNRYMVLHADGSVCDPDAVYFVLRLDSHPNCDEKHVMSCRAACRTYAGLVKDHLPALSHELFMTCDRLSFESRAEIVGIGNLSRPAESEGICHPAAPPWPYLDNECGRNSYRESLAAPAIQEGTK